MFLFAPIRWFFKLVYFALLASVVYVVVSGFQVVTASHLPTQAAALKPAKAIVVLGAPTVGSTAGDDLTDRLEQALLLFDAKQAPTVVLVGAPARGGNAAESSVAKAWLVGRGVPAASLQLLSADDAASGLTLVAASLGEGAKVIVVTDAIDALWTKGAASKAGLTAQVSPAAGSEKAFYEELGPLWRQATGVAVGRLVGYGRTTWAAD